MAKNSPAGNEWLLPADCQLFSTEKSMSYQGVGRHVSMMFPFCQATKNRIQGRVTDRIDDIGVPKTFGHLSDTSKKAERTSAVSPEHYISNQCSGNAQHPITCNVCLRCGKNFWSPGKDSLKAHHSGLRVLRRSF